MSILNYKLLRELKINKGQIIAIVSVTTLGIAVFVAFLSCYFNLVLTRDTYYSRYRFHNFSIQLEKAPINTLFKISELKGIKKVKGRITKDVSMDMENSSDNKIIRLTSIEHYNSNIIDGIHLTQGKMFTKNSSEEGVINQQFFNANKLKLGDRIQLTANGKKVSIKIVGVALSPEYVYPIRNAQEIMPNPEKFGIVWCSESWVAGIFNMKGFYNELVGEVFENNKTSVLMEDIGKQLKPYGVYAKTEQKNQISNWYLSSEIQGLEVSSTVTPAIFLIIASIILVIMLSRMVNRERTQIGLLKAFGYSNFMVAWYYVKFGGIIGLTGGLSGFALGQWMGYGLMSIYVQFYSFPLMRYKVYPWLFISALFISIGCSFLSSIVASFTAIKIMPAEAMREKPPLTSSHTFLEKIEFIWKRLGFTTKIIIRNIWRYPFRALFTVFGVQISTAILIIGYFSQDAMNYMLDHQFNKVQKEDIRITFYKEVGYKAWYESLRFPNVRKTEGLLAQPFELENKWKKKDILITGIPKNVSMLKLLDLNNNEIEVSRTGLVLVDNLAKEMGVKVGDWVTIKPLTRENSKRIKVQVSKIVTMYVGTGAYMSLEYLSRILNASELINSLLIKVEDQNKISDLNKYLKQVPLVATVERKSESLENFYKSVGSSMNISNFFLILFSGIIAISVIYNSTVINLTERKREIASLRVLGFTNQEVGRIVFNENIILSLFGVILGLPFGRWICTLMVKAYETELFRFPFYLSNYTYIISSVIITFFILLTNFFLRSKIKSIDMIESLKSRE